MNLFNLLLAEFTIWLAKRMGMTPQTFMNIVDEVETRRAPYPYYGGKAAIRDKVKKRLTKGDA